ncbi:GMC family oxidoreductase [Agromyces sp. H66]|uniref:GMC oxidoreductase n=1 Tax=Agromyces sp. H66 TaxID=2529859 RepID=UPI0010AA7CFE|nr:GMC family oxidoreductase [Agromyces sp. H66]
MRQRERFDAVVVGSGFGGAVAGARLAQAGLRVAIIERGRRWQAGSFPRNEHDLGDDWLWAKRGGLYDIRWLDRMVSVQGAGWGGGSLVYANVFARPADETFRPHWPASYTRAALDPYFDMVAHMLEVRPITPDPSTGRVPARTTAMEDLVAHLDLASGTVRPNLAIRFADAGADPAVPVANRHGIEQRACTFVGECVIGCNQGAKRSLDVNYLAVAERSGAVAYTGTEVVGLAPVDPGGYRVSAIRHPHADPPVDAGRLEVDADAVFLAAGAVGTTELLLRARDVQGTLPALSARLGEGFSGNGDFLSFISRSRTPLEPDRGPTITTTSIVDFDEAGRQLWFQVQDGAFPAVLARLVGNVMSRMNPATRFGTRAPRSRLPGMPEPHRSVMALLLMGRDASAGRLTLDHRGEAVAGWDNRANARLYRAEALVGRVVARVFGARARSAPTWTYLRRAITVHNLGGVPMGDDAASGVIDEYGHVHGYPGLYVVDGAAVPSATGVNPSASIAAMAERNIEHAIRRMTGDPTWQAPETPHVVPTPAPEDEATALMSQRRRARSGDGVRFRERMSGYLIVAGRRVPARLELEASIPGWRPFLDDARHTVRVEGTLHVEGRITRRPVVGDLDLFPDSGEAAMRYRFDLDDDDGMPIAVTGVKVQHRWNPLALWHDLTTLRIEIRPSDVGPGVGVDRGILRIPTAGVFRLIGSIRGDAFTSAKRNAAVIRFLGYFARGASRGLL